LTRTYCTVRIDSAGSLGKLWQLVLYLLVSLFMDTIDHRLSFELAPSPSSAYLTILL